MLTDEQRGEVFRHLGMPYPGRSNADLVPPLAVSLSTGDGIIGFPTDPHVVGLQFRLNHIDTVVEVKIVGPDHPAFDAYCGFASCIFGVSTVATGAQIVFQVGSESVSFTAGANDTPTTACAALAAMLNADPLISSYAIAMAVGATVVLSARQWGRSSNAISVAAFTSGATCAITAADGVTTVRRLQGGLEPPGPRYTDTSQSPPVAYYGHLPVIKYWESLIGLSAVGMRVDTAGKFKQNPAEYRMRQVAYVTACKNLAQELGVDYYGAGSWRGGQGRTRIT